MRIQGNVSILPWYFKLCGKIVLESKDKCTLNVSMIFYKPCWFFKILLAIFIIWISFIFDLRVHTFGYKARDFGVE
jgi:hypothetical protein